MIELPGTCKSGLKICLLSHWTAMFEMCKFGRSMLLVLAVVLVLVLALELAPELAQVLALVLVLALVQGLASGSHHAWGLEMKQELASSILQPKRNVRRHRKMTPPRC